MTLVQALQEALNDPEVGKQVAEAVSSATIEARQETAATVARLNERVQLEVTKTATTTRKP